MDALKKQVAVIVLFLLLSETLLAKAIEKIQVPENLTSSDLRTQFSQKVIRLILKKTEAEYGPAELRSAGQMNQIRSMDLLKEGEGLDLVVATSNFDVKNEFLLLRPCVIKGLFGIRLFLIKEGRQAEFSRIKDLADLKKMVVGQGLGWPDIEIYRNHNFKVQTGSDYDGLFSMLRASRFDFFPRSVAEIFQELEVHKGEGLVLENSMAIVYPNPVFIFVNRRKRKLFKRFQKGWAAIQRDGSFDKLFLEEESENLRKADLASRKIFYLAVPLANPEDLTEVLETVKSIVR